MNESEKNHLSAENIEDAVLGRLTHDENARVESHLASCTQCRKALEQERLIAAGTKGWARAAMKQKLAGQIAVTAQRRVPWPHVLGAAALLAVIIGVGVLFRWREPAQERDLTFSDTTVSDATLKSKQPASTPATTSDGAISSRQLTPALREDRETVRRDKKDLPAGERQILNEPSMQEEKDKETQPQVIMKAAPAAEVAAAESEGLDVWLGGTQVSSALSGNMQAQPAGASNQGVSLNRLEARKGTHKTESALSPVFVIDQRPRGVLHDARAANDSQNIPTHIVQSGDTLHVVLFLDSLLTPNQLRTTFARQVSADSFQVVLPDRILGYRIPQNITR
jgi:Putative zinc-finger